MSRKKYPDVEVGFRYGKLTVFQRADNRGNQSRYRSLCDCGNTTESFGFTLKTGSAKSCGCVAAQKAKDRWKNPSDEMRQKARDACSNRTHSLSKHPAYRAWADMRSRCENPRNKFFPSYGGRGIYVCQRWQDSANFIADMLPTWRKGLQLGRIDNDGPYSPDNCRWETPVQNQNNKSNNVWLDTPLGRMTVSQAGRAFGLTHGCLKYRLSVGKSGDELFAPSERSR